MPFSVQWSRRAERQVAKLDGQVAATLVRFMRERVHGTDDPRHIGKPLTKSSLWRYRVGDYRVLCEIQDSTLIVLVVEAGHRRQVYR